jgi:hypothetical protein
VQDRLREHKQGVFELVQQGGYFYVCGYVAPGLCVSVSLTGADGWPHRPAAPRALMDECALGLAGTPRAWRGK